MSKPIKIRKRSRLKSGGHDPHRPVGKGNPPRSSQFKPGVSGNPRGRPRKRVSPLESIRAMLEETVLVREAGGVKRISTLDAIMKRLRKSALEGDPKAIQQVLRLMELAGLEGRKDIVGKRGADAAEAAILHELACLVGEDGE